MALPRPGRFRHDFARGIQRQRGILNVGAVAQIAANLKRHEQSALAAIEGHRRGRERDRQIAHRQR